MFKVSGGRANLARVEIGHRNSDMAEIGAGREAGDTVILHPRDRVSDGVKIAERGNDGDAAK